MTNYEKYKDEIDKAVRTNQIYGFFKEHEKEMNCLDLSEEMKSMYFAVFLLQEYKEPDVEVDWSKVPVDTPILVRGASLKQNEWGKRHFAKYEDGVVCAWADGATSWSDGEDYVAWEYAKLVEGD